MEADRERRVGNLRERNLLGNFLKWKTNEIINKYLIMELISIISYIIITLLMRHPAAW